MCQRCDEMDLADTLLAANAPPAPEGRRRIGQLLRKIDEHYRRPIDADVAGIPKEWQSPLNESDIVLRRVGLPDEHLILIAVPTARPVLVGPAETEIDVSGGIGEEFLYRALQHPASFEPVVVEAEGIDAVALGIIYLLVLHFTNTQIIEAEVRGQMRLIVPIE